MNEALTTPLGELRRITPITPVASNCPPVKEPAKDPVMAPPVVPVP